mmetsp:Transcript_85144/g.264538  ORF Transcript_85144/g.264538 Transcript_85144/m.264538 type:complete len:226 (+) Transcript_85144:958-1635(+)
MRRRLSGDRRQGRRQRLPLCHAREIGNRLVAGHAVGGVGRHGCGRVSGDHGGRRQVRSAAPLRLRSQPGAGGPGTRECRRRGHVGLPDDRLILEDCGQRVLRSHVLGGLRPVLRAGVCCGLAASPLGGAAAAGGPRAHHHPGRHRSPGLPRLHGRLQGQPRRVCRHVGDLRHVAGPLGEGGAPRGLRVIGAEDDVRPEQPQHGGLWEAAGRRVPRHQELPGGRAH